MKTRTSLLVSSSTCIGGLAALMAALPLYLYFPIIPYLRFELAEIPVVLGFLVLGPETAALSSVVYWLVLLLVGEYSPIGPTMKFTAVICMVLGLWLGFRLRRSPRTGLLIGSCLGCLFRVAAMSAFNYVVIVIMVPSFLETAAASISAVLGISFPNELTAFLAVLGFTAVFNIIHTILSIAPAYLLVKAVIKAGGEGRAIRKIWYVDVIRAASRRAPPRS